MAAIHITKQDFISRIWDYENNPREWQFKGNKPAIIDFFATWCGPCKMLSPVLDELSEEYMGQIDIYKVDTGQEYELSEAFGIRSVPSLLFIPMLGQPQMAQGALPKSELKQIIDNNLLGNK
uniref:Thioredoxin n=1 Tax=uncultured bacterium pUR16A2 TaxID=1204710 RepID=R9QZ52_9BACT|nr:hypothetical protein [uncultured bacterium pUR16A2]